MTILLLFCCVSLFCERQPCINTKDHLARSNKARWSGVRLCLTVFMIAQLAYLSNEFWNAQRRNQNLISGTRRTRLTTSSWQRSQVSERTGVMPCGGDPQHFEPIGSTQSKS